MINSELKYWALHRHISSCSLLHFSVVRFSGKVLPVAHVFGGGAAGTVVKMNRRPIFQLGSFPSLLWADSCLVVDRISQPRLGRAVHNLVAGFLVFWSCGISVYMGVGGGGGGSWHTCIAHSSIASIRFLSVTSFP